MTRKYKDRDGVTPIHLFNEVWRIGRLNRMRKTHRNHSVIYAPDGKEYHVYDKDATSLRQTRYGWGGEDILKRDKVDSAKVKIYILTSILDERSNWSYDLKSKPNVGDTVKVIYHNGTIKNIKYSGEWETTEIPDKSYNLNHELVYTSKTPKTIKPVCWKIK